MTPAPCAEIDPARWDETLRAAGVTDVYYSRAFVRASAPLVDAEPLLLRLSGGRGDVFLAALLRRDPPDVSAPATQWRTWSSRIRSASDSSAVLTAEICVSTSMQ